MNGETCPFCLEFTDIESSEFRMLFRKDILSSRFIKASPNFVVLAGLGAIRPGYVLILPKEHILSFSFLDRSAADEAQILKANLIQQMIPLFSSMIVFEHGPVGDKVASGGCIDHAHLHLFPTTVNLFPRLSQEFHFRIIRNIHELASLREAGQHYIYYEQAQNGFAFEVDHAIPSQYVRRLLWEAEGCPDEWDWGIFTGHEHIVKTMKAFGQLDELHPRASFDLDGRGAE